MKPMRSDRRSFLYLAASSLAVFVTQPVAHAAGDAKLAARYYDESVTMLKNGHWYERAIGKLTYCVQTSPSNSEYHAALGCAYAARFASLCEAYINRDRKVMSPEEVTAYMSKVGEKVKRGELTVENAETEMPALPKVSPGASPLHTADDNKYVALSREELTGKLRALAASAETAWEKSVATSDSKDELRNALTTQVWGYQLLRLCAEPLSAGFFSAKETEAWREKAERTTSRMVTVFPNEPASHLLLGEVLSPMGKTRWDTATAKLENVYKKSLLLDPDNSAVVFRLYQIAHADKSRQADAEKYLRRFVELEKGNAYAHFFLAGFLAKRVETGTLLKSPDADGIREKVEAVLKIVSKGQLCPKFVAPKTMSEPSALLESALGLFGSEQNQYGTSPIEFNDLAILLVVAAQGYASTDLAFAKTCAYKMLGMGKRITATLNLSDEILPANRPSAHMLELMASNQIRMAYKNLLTLCRKEGNKQEYNTIKQQQDAYVFSIKDRLEKYIARDLSSAAN